MSDITNISSEYELIKIMSDLGAKYFGEDLSTERIGMFGFTTEASAHMYGALLADSIIRSKEISVKSALKRSTLLYNAHKLGIDIPNAMPTNIEAYLGIYADDLIEYGKVVSTNPKTYKLVIEKDTTITINEYVFKPEFDIELTAIYSTTTEKYVYSAKYLTYGDTDETSSPKYTYLDETVSEDISKDFIPCYRTGSETKILLFKVNLKQLEKVRYEYVVTDTDPINLTGIDFNFSNYFSYFNIFYKESSSLTWNLIKAVPKYDTDVYNENIIYYEMLDEDKKIRFDFTGFAPKYNSEFRIEIYSTKGSEVNGLKYVGDGTDIKVVPTSSDDRHTYSGLAMACKPLYTDDTGTDTKSMDELRQYIITNTSILNAIITELDIETYLNLSDPDIIYKVRKTRSDIVNMTYAISGRISTDTGGVIPTRTINTEAPAENNVIINSGTRFMDVNNGRYCSPYDIVIHNNTVRGYASNIKRNVSMQMIDTDDTSEINFRIDHVTISRDIGSNKYKLRVAVMTDGDYSRALSNNNVNIGDTKKVVMLKGYVYNDRAGNNVKAVFDFNFVSYSDDIFIFETELIVTPSVDSSNGDIILSSSTMYNVSDINKGSSTLNEDGEFIIDGELYSPSVIIDSTNFRFGIGCYYLLYDDNEDFLYVNDDRMKVIVKTKYTTVMSTIPGSGNPYPAYTGLCEYTSGTDNFDYRLCDVYSNNMDLVNLYEDMTDIIRIDIGEVDGEDVDHLIDVPCIEYSTISTYNDRLRDIMFSTFDLMTSLKSKLLNNFETDYKYYNTSGESNCFVISFSDGSNPIPLPDLELTVSVSVGLTSSYSTLDTYTLNSIKECIKHHIEQGMIDSGRLYMSNVLTSVTNDMSKYIKYIELNSILNLDQRYRLLTYLEPNDPILPSEFISVPINNINISIE